VLFDLRKTIAESGVEYWYDAADREILKKELFFFFLHFVYLSHCIVASLMSFLYGVFANAKALFDCQQTQRRAASFPLRNTFGLFERRPEREGEHDAGGCTDEVQDNVPYNANRRRRRW
jgi:hypothetical protein